MTDPREWIAQAKARCDAATEGPWTTTRRWDHLYVTGLTTSVAHVGACYDDGKDQPVIADAEHIAAARTDLPRALAALEAVLEECDAADATRVPVTRSAREYVHEAIRRKITAALDGAE